ncbi:alpha-N-acetylgalactosaminidase-like [Chrysoperla carnea]|uniref:alpha-N-acetylgalactosaminidase-like n=1 Tax=Chrysoperla carnea TaxID=189513 RepID=UPI001D077AD1|nr:alpha-N-acetylgalactosaminidase-like [Chrysoperla carnea]
MYYSLLFVLYFMCIVIQNSDGLDNGLALTPPMGWMSWERYRCTIDCEFNRNDEANDECISEKLFKKTADLMVSEGYLEAGYEYVIIDDCWLAMDRDEDGKLQPDPDRFPSGIKALADYIHSKGLKFGIYEDYGTNTCAGYPGIIDNLELDAQTFAEWDVDYIKIDGCYANISDYPKGYPEFGKYLNETGRPIVYSCSWPAYEDESDYEAISKTCNLWRNYGDIQDSWSSATSIINWYGDNQDKFAQYAGPGHWNDPDMLIVGNFGLTYGQSRAQMALWSLLAAPLLLSTDLANVRPEYKEILLNEDLIAINKDPLGIQGLRIIQKDGIEVWTRPITPIIDEYESYAIVILNQNEDPAPTKVSIRVRKIGLKAKKYTLKDLYDPEKSPKEPTDHINVSVDPSGGVVALKATPVKRKLGLPQINEIDN